MTSSFVLPVTKPRDVKGACHPTIILVYSSVYPNENEGVRCVCVCVGGGGGEGVTLTAEKIGTYC